MAREWRVRQVSLGAAIVGGFVALVVGVIVGVNWDAIAGEFGPYLGARKVEKTDWSELDTVYSELKSSFDGDLDKQKLLEGAKRGLVAAAGDRYTVFMSRLEAVEFNKSLHGDVGAGIGVEIGERDGWVKVLRTLPDNPARRAGVLAGDIMYKVDGEDITALSADEVAQKVRGAVGTEVTITVVRDKQEKEFKMRREMINNVSAYVDYKGKVAIITITRFDNDTGALVRGFAEEINKKGIERVVLDLRNNGGGYVKAATEVLGLWVDGQVIAREKSKSGYYNTEERTVSGQAILAGKKTVVLINGSSASASEIVAGALKDYKLVTLIGEKSFGKGSVQDLVELDGGEMIKITIAKWYTPDGKNIDGEGIEPDKKVERSFDDINLERDPQMDAAILELK